MIKNETFDHQLPADFHIHVSRVGVKTISRFKWLLVGTNELQRQIILKNF